MPTDHAGEYIKIPGTSPTNFIGKLPRISQRANYLLNFSAAGQTPTSTFADAVGNILRLVTNAASVCAIDNMTATGINPPNACGFGTPADDNNVMSRWVASGAGAYDVRSCSSIFHTNTSTVLAPSDYVTNELYGQWGDGIAYGNTQNFAPSSGRTSITRNNLMLMAVHDFGDNFITRQLAAATGLSSSGFANDSYLGGRGLSSYTTLPGGQHPGYLVKLPTTLRSVIWATSSGGTTARFIVSYKLSLVMLTFPGAINASPNVTVLTTGSANTITAIPFSGTSLVTVSGVTAYQNTHATGLPSNYFLDAASIPSGPWLLAVTVTDWSVTYPTVTTTKSLTLDAYTMSYYAAWNYPGYTGTYLPGEVTDYPSCVSE
jgi:hypothetical protein